MTLATMRPLSKPEIISYLLLQQVLWFLVVWGAAHGHLWWPAALTAAILAAACWRAGPAWWRILAVIGVGLACGFSVDGTLHKMGVIIYAGGDPGLAVPPAWILVLWSLFAGTLALPARAALTSPVAAAILGGIGGPLAYAGGRALGALSVNTTGLIVVGICYAIGTAMIVLFANRLLPVPPQVRQLAPRPRTRQS